MDFLAPGIASTIVGFFFGCFFGAGCALALMYAIYSGGYRKALEDSLRDEKSAAYYRWLPYVQKKLAREDAVRTAKRPAASNQ